MRAIAGLACFAVACTGHWTDGVPPPDAAVSYTLRSLTDVCDDNPTLTGQRALAIVMPRYTATYTPLHGGAPSMLVQTVAYDAGTITCHPAMTNIELSTDASLDLAVHAAVATSDGLFDESFAATISLPADVQDSLAFDGSVAIADLHGTYAPMIPGSWQSHDVDFGGMLAAAGTTSGTVVEGASTADGGETGNAGSWL